MRARTERSRLMAVIKRPVKETAIAVCDDGLLP